MHNINPSLVLGQALAWAEKNGKLENIREHERSRIDLRLYDTEGAGFYVVQGLSPIKWYYDEDPTDGHWGNTSLDDVQAAINAGGRVQLVGPRGVSIGIWASWEDFAKETDL